MAVQPMRTDDNDRGIRPAGSAHTATDKRLRYRLDVIAADAADVVECAGGWLFDRAMAGWDVNVVLLEPGDVRPLQVLGARPLERAELSTVLSGPDRAAGLVVAGNVLAADADVRDGVRAILRSGRTEVAVWGSRWPDALGGRADAVRYQLSAAARVFKSHARGAAGGNRVTVSGDELMFRGGYRPVDSDLIAVG